MIASETINESVNEPPYDKNGSVIPVVGIVPVVTSKLRHVCKIISNDKPKTKYFLKCTIFWIINIY